MRQITLRLEDDLLEALDEEADSRGVSRSEHVRKALRTRNESDLLRDRVEELETRVADREARVEELEARLDAREERIADLEEQLARRSQLEQKVEDLPDKVRQASSYQERRRRLLDEASLAQRIKWRVTGVPVDAIDEEPTR